MVKRALVVAILVLSFVSAAFSQNIAAKASTDTSSYLVGDYINYVIQVSYDEGLKVYPPAIQDSLRDVTLIQEKQPVVERKDGKVTATYAFVLSGYDSAGITIPPIPVFYQASGDTTMHHALTNAVSFTVRTLKVNTQAGIKDIKSPIKIPFDWRWIMLWILVVLLVAGVAYYLYRRYRKKRAEAQQVKEVVKIPPHEIALNALHRLEEEKLWQRGLIKEYHSGITEIIRRYFEDRFDMPALELPTSETVELLRQRQGSMSILDVTYSFLSNADLVKFAKFTPLDSVNEEMMKQAYEIVNKTVPVDERKTEPSNVR